MQELHEQPCKLLFPKVFSPFPAKEQQLLPTNQPESIQSLWPFFSIALTVRTTVLSISNVGYIREIWVNICTVKSKFHFDYMPKLHALRFHSVMCMRNSCKAPNSAEIVTLWCPDQHPNRFFSFKLMVLSKMHRVFWMNLAKNSVSRFGQKSSACLQSYFCR